MNEWIVQVRTRVDGFTLDVHLHERDGVLALVGENGSGKSTLLRAMMGAAPVKHGKITVHGRVLLDTDTGVFVPIEARGFAYVPQGGGLFPHLSVSDNICFGLREKRRDLHAKQRDEFALRTLEELGCAHLMKRSVRSLSGGERQKIAIARATMSEASFLLLDEPLSALDIRAKRETRRFLMDVFERLSVPTIVVTHDVRDVRAFGARMCVLEAGRVSQKGLWEDVRADPRSSFMCAFFDEE